MQGPALGLHGAGMGGPQELSMETFILHAPQISFICQGKYIPVKFPMPKFLEVMLRGVDGGPRARDALD